MATNVMSCFKLLISNMQSGSKKPSTGTPNEKVAPICIFFALSYHAVQLLSARRGTASTMEEFDLKGKNILEITVFVARSLHFDIPR